MPSLIGNKPNQVPTNGDLGRLAFMDNLDSFTSKTVMDTDITNIAPSLNLDFANSKVLDSRITFTRASTATFYNGVSSAVAEQNLILNSQNWAISPWSTVGGGTPTATANADVAPDGTTTATSLVFSAQYQNRSQVQTPIVAGTVYTVSFYAKTISGNTALSIVYEASGSANTPITTTSSWARYSVTFTAAATSAFGTLGIQDRNASGFGTTLVWGAQFEQRSAVTAYTPTTTAAVTNYIPTLSTAANGVARFDHNPITGESLGLLIEEQRTNLLLRSEEFDNASWVKGNINITSNSVIAPNGTLTADTAIIAAATASSNLYQSVTLAANTTTAISCYAKFAGVRYLNIGFAYTAGVYAGYQFDLVNGVVVGGNAANGTNVSSLITPVGNGWYRCVAVCSITLANPSPVFLPSNVAYTSGNAWYNLSLTGDGYSGMFIWGAQLEAGSFATSYIPTVASQVTRSPDAASMTGTNFSSWYNPAEGTVYTDLKYIGTGSGFSLSISDGTTSNRGYQLTALSATNLSTQVVNAGTTIVDINNTVISALNNNKIAFGYKSNDFAASVNGANVSTDTSGTPPVVNSLQFSLANGSAPANMTMKKLSYYPRKLLNDELREMTA